MNKTKDTVDVYFKDTINEEIDFIVMANDKVFDTVTFNPSAKNKLLFNVKEGIQPMLNATLLIPLFYTKEINKRLLITF